MDKPAPVDHPIHDLLRQRWSPRAFAERPVAPALVRSLLEAARWAPSCFNEQPWAVLVAAREEAEEYRRLLECLVPANQTWAKRAPVLLLSVARRAFARNGKPNRHALHDVGLAMGNLTVEATARGLVVHQMAGIDVDRCRETYQIPEDWEPVTGLALGYPGDPAVLPEELREREQAPRQRKPLAEWVFTGRWESPAALLDGAPPS